MKACLRRAVGLLWPHLTLPSSDDVALLGLLWNSDLWLLTTNEEGLLLLSPGRIYANALACAQSEALPVTRPTVCISMRRPCGMRFCDSDATTFLEPVNSTMRSLTTHAYRSPSTQQCVVSPMRTGTRQLDNAWSHHPCVPIDCSIAVCAPPNTLWLDVGRAPPAAQRCMGRLCHAGRPPLPPPQSNTRAW